jgi:predicted alpha/beta-fold hydrolase
MLSNIAAGGESGGKAGLVLLFIGANIVLSFMMSPSVPSISISKDNNHNDDKDSTSDMAASLPHTLGCFVTGYQCVAECHAELKPFINRVLQQNPYIPTWWALRIDIHGQLQTSVQTMWRSVTGFLLPLKYDRMLVYTEDGGLVALDWITHRGRQQLQQPQNSNKDKVVILFHGLCGDSCSDYIVHIADILLTEGYEVVAGVARGCGGLSLISKSSSFIQHRDVKVSDVATIIQRVRQERPGSKLYALGFSLGAAMLLKELAKQGSQDGISSQDGTSNQDTILAEVIGRHLTAAACVSPPWNMLRKTKVFHIWSPILTAAVKLYALSHYATVRAQGVSLRKVRFSI